MRTPVTTVLVAGLALTAIVAAITLTHAPLTLLGSNPVSEEGEITQLRGGTRMCQADELLPRGTSALRLAFNMALGARLSVEASAGGRVVAHGLRASGWRGSDVTVPLTSTVSEAQHVTICMSFGVSNEPVGLIGGQTQPAKAARDDGKPLPGRVKIEYLHTGSRSWWSLAPDVVRRMGLGRAWSGSWVALLVAALMLATLAVGGWIAVRELR